MKLKEQLDEFVDERKGWATRFLFLSFYYSEFLLHPSVFLKCLFESFRWLEEIDRRQAELVAAQIALEKHRQQEQLLRTENEVLKVETA